MRIMRLDEPRPISDEPLRAGNVEVPIPGPGQIRVRVHVCGVCHTDLHTVEGDISLPKLPVVPGHQIVGTVDSLGTDSDRYQVGDRVGVAWLNWSCGQCEYCLNGRENLCPDARFTGLHVDGGYAEYAVVDERYAYPLPSGFSDENAAPLLCAGIIGYRSLRMAGMKPGSNLGLYGFGASAHLAIQVARYWECQFFVFTRSEAHRRHALELGAAWAGGAEEDPPSLLDGSVTFAPVGWIIPLALRHLKPGGTLAINAIHMSPVPELSYNLLYGERVLRSVANFTRQDAEEFLTLASQIPVKTSVESFALAEANEVLQRLKKSAIKGAAVLNVCA